MLLRQLMGQNPAARAYWVSSETVVRLASGEVQATSSTSLSRKGQALGSRALSFHTVHLCAPLVIRLSRHFLTFSCSWILPSDPLSAWTPSYPFPRPGAQAPTRGGRG